MPDDPPVTEYGSIGEYTITARPADDLPLPPPPAPDPPPRYGSDDPDALTLVVDGRTWGGWDDVKVTRSCEKMPSSFTISLTERFPGESADLVIEPGQTCVVKMGRDTVLTGYVDRYVPALDAKQHRVTIMGRSKSQDLVDCAAIFDTFQISGQTVGAIARTLAEKYGIEVLTPTGDGPVVPQLNMQLGETTWDVVERLSRFAKFLCYDDPEGRVVLRPVSDEKHSSGVEQGKNLLAALPDYGMDQRFSQYHVYPLSVLPLLQAENAAGGTALPPPIGQAQDTGVKRLRRRIIILEHSGTGPLQEFARQRAEWESSRRFGRSESIVVTVDSWRDSGGRLWEPNRRAAVKVPSCKVEPDGEWTIGEVTFQRGTGGTTARLTLMDPRAFEPQYDPLYQYNWQVREAGAQGDQPSTNPRRNEPTGGV